MVTVSPALHVADRGDALTKKKVSRISLPTRLSLVVPSSRVLVASSSVSTRVYCPSSWSCLDFWQTSPMSTMRNRPALAGTEGMLQMKRSLGPPLTQYSVMTALLQLGAFIGAALSGFFADRYSRKASIGE